MKSRYLYKVFSGSIGLAVGALMSVVVPRALGPQSYGDFGFLRSTFQSVLDFMNLGSTGAFFNYNSRHEESWRVVKLYFVFLVLLFSTVLFGIQVLHWCGLLSSVLPHQELRFVYLGFFFVFSDFLITISSGFADAKRLTKNFELMRLGAKITVLFGISSCYLLKQLSLTTYFMLLTAFNCGLIAFAWRRFLRSTSLAMFPVTMDFVREVKGFFWRFCSPLATLLFISSAFSFIDRWLLQRVYGSSEQGFYTLGFQVSTVCFLFTASMTPLFVKEMTEAHHLKDLEKMKSLVLKYIPLFYLIACVLSVFVSFQSSFIVDLVGGERFRGAVIPLAIIGVYPIYQTYGQLSGSIFMATDRTKTYRNIALASLVFSLPLSYFLLAPRTYFGLNLGAVGLALKLVLLNAVIVNVQLWYNCRFLGLAYRRHLLQQFTILGAVCLMFGAAKLSVSLIPFANIFSNSLAAKGANVFLTALVFFPMTLFFALKTELIPRNTLSFFRGR